MPRRPNVFAGPYLDRLAHLRKDDAWVAAALADPRTHVVPVWRSRNLLHRRADGLAAAFLSAAHVAGDPRLASGEFVLLGRHDGCTYFALELVESAPALEALGGDEAVRFEDLRLAGGQLEAQPAGVLAYARAMLHWRSRHRFCGVCGSPNTPVQAGHVMRCTHPACATDHFPRLDPAIIVLVTDGARALLGRQASWPAGRYSTIAGFVEPGESLEDAVAREVLEETGVTVSEAEYHSSQPWPFPSSLMIGYIAQAAPGQAPKADDELEDVRWFSRADIASGTPGLPPPQSVSHRLIEDWYDSGAERPLRETPGVQTWHAPRR